MDYSQRAKAFFQQVLSNGRLEQLPDFVAEDYKTQVPELRGMPVPENGDSAIRVGWAEERSPTSVRCSGAETVGLRSSAQPTLWATKKENP
ncbi:MAG: hypothetical protein WC997_03975 [Porticoccaceae bacterium]